VSDLLGITIDDLVAALKRRRAPLPFEIGAFVALSACDALASAPAIVHGRDVRIAPDGTVSVFVPPNSTSDEASARSLVALLAQMLVAAGPGVPYVLLSLIDRGPADGTWRIARVRDELEAALVPLNRGASRRVLARLVREATREQRPSTMPPAPEAASLDALDDDLDALLGGGPPSARPAARPVSMRPAAAMQPAAPRPISAPPSISVAPQVRARPSARPAPAAPAPAVLDDDLDALLDRGLASAPPTPARDFWAAAAAAEEPSAFDRPTRRRERDSLDVPRAPESDDYESDAPFDTLAGAPAPPLDDDTANADEPTGAHATGRPPAYEYGAAVDEFEPVPRRAEHQREITQEVPLEELRFPPPARLPSEAGGQRAPSAKAAAAPRRDAAREAIDSPVPPAPAAAGPRVVADRLSLDGFDDAPKKGKGALYAVLALLVSFVVLVVGVYTFRPDVLDRLRGAPDPAEAAAARLAEEHRRAQDEINARAAARFGDLLVRSTPDRTQVLLYIGRGPAVAKDLPIGVAHEFVVLADGKASVRAIVAPDADWETTPEGKRYELAMMAGDADVSFELLDLGPTKLPRDVGTPGTDLGQVRVITAPRGAKVYQLIGFTPDVRIADVRTDEAAELVLFAEGYVPQRIVVGPSDWRDEGGERVAEVNVTLVERPTRRR